MFNPWVTQNPADIYSMWSKAWSNTSSASSVYAQMHELGNAFRSMFEAGPNSADHTSRQKQMEQMVRQFTMNPTLPNFPSMMEFMNHNPWQQFFDQGRTLMGSPSTGSQPPALGIGREYQEDWTEFLRLRQEYESALREFTAVFEKFTLGASERFVESISEIDESTGFEDVCRRWIECCDEEFQKIASTQEYCIAYGNLINAHMRLLRHGTRIQEQFATMMGQPTRTELNSLHLKNRQASTEIENLNQKIQDMEKSLERARASQRKQTSRKSSAPRKPVARDKKKK